MRAFQKNIALVMLSTALMLVLSSGFMALTFGVSLVTVVQILGASINPIPLLIMFGGLGLMGTVYARRHGEALWTYERENEWPITQRHVLNVLAGWWVVVLGFGILARIVGQEMLVEFIGILLAFCVGVLVFLSVLLLGTTISFEATRRT